jgi:hypothetical protein
MSQHRDHPQRQLKEAEIELDAARRPSEIRAAATKRRLALQGLQWLDEREAKPERSPSRRGRGGGGGASRAKPRGRPDASCQAFRELRRKSCGAAVAVENRSGSVSRA